MSIELKARGTWVLRPKGKMGTDTKCGGICTLQGCRKVSCGKLHDYLQGMEWKAVIKDITGKLSRIIMETIVAFRMNGLVFIMVQR